LKELSHAGKGNFQQIPQHLEGQHPKPKYHILAILSHRHMKCCSKNNKIEVQNMFFSYLYCLG